MVKLLECLDFSLDGLLLHLVLQLGLLVDFDGKFLLCSQMSHRSDHCTSSLAYYSAEVVITEFKDLLGLHPGLSGSAHLFCSRVLSLRS